jgi:hypothetical protein
LGALFGEALLLVFLRGGGGAQDSGPLHGFAYCLGEQVHCVCDVEVHEVQGFCFFSEDPLELGLVTFAEGFGEKAS